MSKMIEGSKKFRRLATEMLWGTRKVYSCQKCGHPVLDGYTCRWCDCESPVKQDQEPVEFV